MDNIYGFFLSLNFLSSAYNILLEEGLFRSLSLFGVLYSTECHIFLFYSVSWLKFVLGMQKKYFFKQHIYVYYSRSMFQLEWTQNCEKPASWWIAQTSKANIGKK